ncbi:MAG: phosphoribosyltransferase [Leptolyngbyaceae cyanobacterium CSU_1_3]|nr:phosphoribosyltransferase [Leptolyngbyaceae cyanobacterium CSU_1_3]
MSLSQLFQSSDTTLFVDRGDAGEKLAQAVLAEAQHLENSPRFVAYALPRGGLPIAAPIARALNCPLDVIVAKKITRPENPELAIGAVTANGQVLSLRPKSANSIPEKVWEQECQRAQEKAKQQLAQFEDYRPGIDPEGAIALIVDDGIATGMTIAVAVKALRTHHPAEIWICAPVAPLEMVEALQGGCDRLIVLAAPAHFQSVSRFYQVFTQVETDAAIACLQNFYQLKSSSQPLSSTPDQKQMADDQ